MTIKSRIRDFLIDFIEITIISIFGLIGLVFIFTTPFEPPEDRRKTLWQRLREGIKAMCKAILNVRRRRRSIRNLSIIINNKKI